MLAPEGGAAGHVAGATVLVVERTGTPNTVELDEAGTYRITGMPPGVYPVVAVVPGVAEWQLAAAARNGLLKGPAGYEVGGNCALRLCYNWLPRGRAQLNHYQTSQT